MLECPITHSVLIHSRLRHTSSGSPNVFCSLTLTPFFSKLSQYLLIIPQKLVPWIIHGGTLWQPWTLFKSWPTYSTEQKMQQDVRSVVKSAEDVVTAGICCYNKSELDSCLSSLDGSIYLSKQLHEMKKRNKNISLFLCCLASPVGSLGCVTSSNQCSVHFSPSTSDRVKAQEGGGRWAMGSFLKKNRSDHSFDFYLAVDGILCGRS